MGFKFFLRMAVRNLKSNRKFYGPFMVAAAITAAMFFMMISLLEISFVESNSSLSALIMIGGTVIGLFSVIFLIYTNSVIQKTRQKELGLYSVLGLEKKHLVRVMFMENSLVACGSILLGVIVGIVFGYLNFLFINYLMQLPVPMEFAFAPKSVLLTVLVFAGIFTLLFFFNVLRIIRAKPIHLLKESSAGEREPKGSWLIFLAGLLFVGAGYWLSFTTEDVKVFVNLFLAIILVIIGTYGLFTAGSIIILKLMKRNKGLYYQPGPFISISGMLYRMKAHAVGLANISILSTMVIVAVSTTLSMYVGTEKTLEALSPTEHSVTIISSDQSGELLTQQLGDMQGAVQNFSAERGRQVTDLTLVRAVNLMGSIENNELFQSDYSFTSETWDIRLMPQMDFNQLAETNLQLADDELGFYSSKDKAAPENLTIWGQTYVVKVIDEIPESLKNYESLYELNMLVMPTVQAIDRLNRLTKEDEFPLKYNASLGYNLNEASEAEDKQYSQELHAFLDSYQADYDFYYQARSDQHEEWYIMNGGLLFLGIFLGGLFLIGTILITYFKQISEGMADRERIQIMQKVGLSRDMTKKATNAQVLWLFFLPIMVAVIHTLFAFPILNKLLALLGVTYTTIVWVSIASVALIFMAIYWLIYKGTSKVYLDIVE